MSNVISKLSNNVTDHYTSIDVGWLLCYIKTVHQELDQRFSRRGLIFISNREEEEVA